MDRAGAGASSGGSTAERLADRPEPPFACFDFGQSAEMRQTIYIGKFPEQRLLSFDLGLRVGSGQVDERKLLAGTQHVKKIHARADWIETHHACPRRKLYEPGSDRKSVV